MTKPRFCEKYTKNRQAFTRRHHRRRRRIRGFHINHIYKEKKKAGNLRTIQNLKHLNMLLIIISK